MSTLSTPPRRFPGRLFLWIGLALWALGVLAYVVQIATKTLKAPWYLPALATLGVLFVVVSLWQARTLWRVLALLLVVLFAGASWAVLLATLPPYAGPVLVGQPFPAFATLRADGAPFSQRDLRGEPNNVLVFFRGRW